MCWLFELAYESWGYYECVCNVYGVGYQCNNDFAKVQTDIYYYTFGIDKIYQVVFKRIKSICMRCAQKQSTRVLSTYRIALIIFSIMMFSICNTHKKSFRMMDIKSTFISMENIHSNARCINANHHNNYYFTVCNEFE